MRKSRMSLPLRITWFLISAFAICYPSYYALARLPFLLEGGSEGVFSFFSGIPLTKSSDKSSSVTMLEDDDWYAFSPDEGAIPYVAPVTTREDTVETPPEEAEPLKVITIESKIKPKNNPELPFDQNALLHQPLSFDRTTQTVLIIHSHGSESYSQYQNAFWAENKDVRTTNPDKNVVAVGRVLRDELIEYGFRVIHDETLCDQPYNTSYKTALTLIEKHMKADSSIGMVLDLHRDSLTATDGIRYKVLSSDGKSAQLMFVVGSNKLLSHNEWQDNLAFALHLQSDLMEHHTNLMRPISISKNRYNQHVTPFSLIIECGTEANTLAEAKESIKSFASSLDRVLPVN